MTTKAVANAWMSLCRQGRHHQVMERLLSVEIVRASQHTRAGWARRPEKESRCHIRRPAIEVWGWAWAERGIDRVELKLF
jgi:hypothetical protein